MGPHEVVITGYAGHEDDILRLRNANRPDVQTRHFLDWRYVRPSNAPHPVVFWLQSGSGNPVGMASLIFSLYWVNNEPTYLAVLGDISLDAGCRGKGLGRRLLESVTRYLDQPRRQAAGFVIPNAAAERSLLSAGWAIGGELRPHVFLLNPAGRLRGALPGERLARQASRVYRTVSSGILRLQSKQGHSLNVVDELDESFESFWKEFPKADLIIQDKGLASLSWRYARHPHHTFKIAKLARRQRLLGYLIFRVSDEDQTCFVYDMIVRRPEDVLCLMASFVGYCDSNTNVSTIRLLLNDRHPYSTGLWKIGFFRRSPQGTFQLHAPGGASRLSSSRWYLTYGDKDV